MALKQDVKDALKVNRKTFFNPAGWLGYQELKGYTQIVWGAIKGVFTLKTPTGTKETFAEAVKRLNLTEKDIQSTARHFLISSIVLAFFGIASVFGSFYFLFIHAAIIAWFLGLVISGLFFSQAFRFHFWYFQMKYRKLGCTFAEWKRGKPFDTEGKNP